MARIRSIKPDFFLDEKLADLSPTHRLVFVGLWTLADRRGRLEDRPRWIKAQVAPYDDCDIDRVLNDLSGSGFIVRYEAEGKQCIWVVNFEKHQRFSGKEAESESDLPSCPEPGKQRGSIGEALGKHPGSQEGKGREGKVEEGKGKDLSPAQERLFLEVPSEPANPTDPGAVSADALKDLWNELAAPAGCSRWESTTDQRLAHVKARLSERKAWTLRGASESWEALFKRIAGSTFLTGQKNVGNAGWIFKPENFAKVLEGNYDNRAGPAKPTGSRRIAAEDTDWSKQPTGDITDAF